MPHQAVDSIAELGVRFPDAPLASAETPELEVTQAPIEVGAYVIHLLDRPAVETAERGVFPAVLDRPKAIRLETPFPKPLESRVFSAPQGDHVEASPAGGTAARGLCGPLG